MSLVERQCPGCSLMGGPHFEGCPNGEHSKYNKSIELPPIEGPVPGVDIPHFATGMSEAKPHLEVGEIYQKIEPSVGTRLVCTRCGRGDWHTLILRRKAGLLEGLCMQVDGTGCYPSSPRGNCQYTDADQGDCPQLAEYSIAIGEERLNPRNVCRDHVGHLLRQGPLYMMWPLED